MFYKINSDGIYIPPVQVCHRDDEYDQGGFETLLNMQERHFWYRGRHRFLLYALDRYLPKISGGNKAIDLGGGAGGWVRFIAQRRIELFSQLALADSSIIALTHAKSLLPPDAQRYQIDLMNLYMQKEWDAAFLLDVIEHLPDDKRALEQAKEALKPGGLLFVTAPAFHKFWSYNDEVVHHLRRYRRMDFIHLARQTDLELLDARYFMFFLSPLYVLSRMKTGGGLTTEEKKALVLKQHKIPIPPINKLLNAMFAAESPLGHWVKFPWGTSILGVFRKP